MSLTQSLGLVVITAPEVRGRIRADFKKVITNRKALPSRRFVSLPFEAIDRFEREHLAQVHQDGAFYVARPAPAHAERCYLWIESDTGVLTLLFQEDKVIRVNKGSSAFREMCAKGGDAVLIGWYSTERCGTYLRGTFTAGDVFRFNGLDVATKDMHIRSGILQGVKERIASRNITLPFAYTHLQWTTIATLRTLLAPDIESKYDDDEAAQTYKHTQS